MKNSIYLFFTIFTFFFAFNTTIFAQAYGTAAGLRVGSSGLGLTVQQQIASHSTIEGIIQAGFFDRNRTTYTFLFEQHQPILVRNLNFYGGAGIQHSNYKDRDFRDNPTGLAFIAGVEATLGRMNGSLDFKPVLNIKKGTSDLIGGDIAISFRYVFVKTLFKNKRKNWFN